MAANFLNTNINATRYFFATTESGEQNLGLAFGTTGGLPSLSTMSVTLSGGGGSEIVNIAPQFLASQFCLGEEALITGSASEYFTASTLVSSVTGVNISFDRGNGTGTACIESYAQNGSLGGFEYLNRGLNSELVSTNSVIYNNFVSSIGRVGAAAVLTTGGTWLAPTLTATTHNTFIDVSGNFSTIALYPAYKDNTEFGAESNVTTIAGSSNQASPFMPLFSTPVSGLNPNTQAYISINWANALSTGSNHVNFKVGFSTATAYTNLVQTSYIPGGNFTPSGQLSATSPVGYTLISGACDPDGINDDGTGMLYVLGQLSDPNGAADLLYIAKGLVTENTRNALVYRSF